MACVGLSETSNKVVSSANERLEVRINFGEECYAVLSESHQANVKRSERNRIRNTILCFIFKGQVNLTHHPVGLINKKLSNKDS